VADETVSTFNAGASMLGYLYQVRVALLWAIRQSRVGDFSVSLETLDDVAACARLKQAAITSTNVNLKAAFDAFLSLEDSDREQLLASSTLYPVSPMRMPSAYSSRPSYIRSHFTIRRFRCKSMRARRL
jgi:hypothetical protein